MTKMPTATNRINPPITVPTISPTGGVVSCPTDGVVSSGEDSVGAGVGGLAVDEGAGVGAGGDGAGGAGGFPLRSGVGACARVTDDNSGRLRPYSEGYDRTVVGGAIGGAVGLPPYGQGYVGG